MVKKIRFIYALLKVDSKRNLFHITSETLFYKTYLLALS